MFFNPLTRKVIFKQSRLIISLKHKTTNATIDITELDSEGTSHLDVIDDESKDRERKLELRRNKSGLNASDYNKLHDNVPYAEPLHWSHNTLKYQQKMFGKYGESSGLDPSYCWPTRQELQCTINSENLTDLYTIQETAQKAKVAREDREEQLWKRQKDIVMRLQKLAMWKQDLHSRIAKKEMEAIDAKSRKDRLVEEVRRHFGYTVDPKSDKFKEMLEKKEKQQNKALKEAKKKAKEEKMLDRISAGLKTEEKNKY